MRPVVESAIACEEHDLDRPECREQDTGACVTTKGASCWCKIDEWDAERWVREKARTAAVDAYRATSEQETTNAD